MKYESKNIVLTLIGSYVASHRAVKEMRFDKKVYRMIDEIVTLCASEGIEVDLIFPDVIQYHSKFRTWQRDRICAIADHIKDVALRIKDYPDMTDSSDIKEMKHLTMLMSKIIG